MISLAVHAAAFLLAGMLVVFSVVNKEEKKFVPPKPVNRPKMKLKKPKVKVKKSAKPKATTRIVTKVRRASMPDIQLPEMSGMGEALAGGIGGFEITPDLGEISVFGGGQTIGNDFEGTFYDLKRDRRGRKVPMDGEQFLLLLRNFATSGWRDSKLARFYQAPAKLYTTHFMVPPVVAPMAPDLFGSPDVESYYFFVKYKGQLVYKEDVRFRFWGTGDAYILVNVDGKNVFVNGVEGRLDILDYWKTSSADSYKYWLADKTMKVGDWITLKAGEPVDMQVLFGEWAGGLVSGMLLVEFDGVEYPQTRQGGPLLPAFKTEKFSLDMLEQILKYLPEGECSLTTGPVFNDYHSPSSQPEAASSTQPVAKTPKPGVEPSRGDEKEKVGPRAWSMANGKTVEAEFVALLGGKVSLKNLKGKTLKIPANQFSESDLSYIELQMPPKLDLQFSKTTTQRVFPDMLPASNPPRSLYYDFKARIKQTSTKPYNHELVVELFVFADEIAGDKKILLDYQKVPCKLTEGSKSIFEITGKRSELIDYVAGGQRRGEKFSGYMIVVTDPRGEIIAYKAPNEEIFQNLERLRKVPIGKCFDENCNRCFSTSPKRFY